MWQKNGSKKELKKGVKKGLKMGSLLALFGHFFLRYLTRKLGLFLPFLLLINETFTPKEIVKSCQNGFFRSFFFTGLSVSRYVWKRLKNALFLSFWRFFDIFIGVKVWFISDKNGQKMGKIAKNGLFRHFFWHLKSS